MALSLQRRKEKGRGNEKGFAPPLNLYRSKEETLSRFQIKLFHRLPLQLVLDVERTERQQAEQDAGRERAVSVVPVFGCKISSFGKREKR